MHLLISLIIIWHGLGGNPYAPPYQDVAQATISSMEQKYGPLGGGEVALHLYDDPVQYQESPHRNRAYVPRLDRHRVAYEVARVVFRETVNPHGLNVNWLESGVAAVEHGSRYRQLCRHKYINVKRTLRGNDIVLTWALVTYLTEVARIQTLLSVTKSGSQPTEALVFDQADGWQEWVNQKCNR